MDNQKLDELQKLCAELKNAWQITASGGIVGRVILSEQLDRLELLIAALYDHQDAEQTNTWRCFHCDETFTDAEQAALHFGASQIDNPSCQVDVQHLRNLETELRRYREDDTDLWRYIYRLGSEHNTKLMQEEEKGYARGLKDSALLSQCEQIEIAQAAILSAQSFAASGAVIAATPTVQADHIADVTKMVPEPVSDELLQKIGEEIDFVDVRNFLNRQGCMVYPIAQIVDIAEQVILARSKGGTA